MTVLGHAGHWLVQLLYAAPVLALLVFIVLGQLRERKARKTAGDELDSDRESRS